MGYYRSSVGGVEKLDLAYEAQQPGGVAGDTVIRPAGEMELTEFADLVMALLENTQMGRVGGVRGEDRDLRVTG